MPLDQHTLHAALGQVVEEADPRDPAADDQHVGAIRQAPRIALRRARPEGGAQSSRTTRTNNMDVQHGF